VALEDATRFRHELNTYSISRDQNITMLSTLRREYRWLWNRHRNLREDISVTITPTSLRSVQSSLVRASIQVLRPPLNYSRRPPQLVPLFPLGPYTPNSKCPHHGPIESGSVFCCMICHNSGQDDHPALRTNHTLTQNSNREPHMPFRRNDDHESALPETRRQRRQKVFRGTNRS
jgi:hypothetical protein